MDRKDEATRTRTKYRLRNRVGWDDRTGLDRRPDLRFPNCCTCRRNYETVRLDTFASSFEPGKSWRSTFLMYRWAEDRRERHPHPNLLINYIISYFHICFFFIFNGISFYSLARIRLVSKRASAKSSLFPPFLDAWLNALLIDFRNANFPAYSVILWKKNKRYMKKRRIVCG